MSDLLSDDINDFCFIDTETKALPGTAGLVDDDVTEVGAYRYSEGARVIMVQYAIGEGPVHVEAVPDFRLDRRLTWDNLPADLQELRDRANYGEAWFVPWNAAFDRLMLGTLPGASIKLEGFIDAMAQAAASNLPGKLEAASRFIGRQGKQSNGKDLIKLFTGPDGWLYDNNLTSRLDGATPQTHPLQWQQFMSYGKQDIEELRAVFLSTRQLPRREWEEYWASERINDRGKLIDVEFATRCAAIADLNRLRMNRICARLTADETDKKKRITKVTERERIANWLYNKCPVEDARDKLVKAWVEEDDELAEMEDAAGISEPVLVPKKISIAEDRLNAYINVLEHLDETEGLTDAEYNLLELAEARRTGASATPAKFQKALDQRSSDDRLRGPYRFNGAQQTGRFSSVGVQEHNLVRASLTDKAHPTREVDVIEFINNLEV